MNLDRIKIWKPEQFPSPCNFECLKLGFCPISGEEGHCDIISNLNSAQHIRTIKIAYTQKTPVEKIGGITNISFVDNDRREKRHFGAIEEYSHVDEIRVGNGVERHVIVPIKYKGKSMINRWFASRVVKEFLNAQGITYQKGKEFWRRKNGMLLIKGRTIVAMLRWIKAEEEAGNPKLLDYYGFPKYSIEYLDELIKELTSGRYALNMDIPLVERFRIRLGDGTFVKLPFKVTDKTEIDRNEFYEYLNNQIKLEGH